ncbi:MAG TPA: hypothetical protein VIY73_10965 [Polyangiaceae bacterium]
MTPKLLIAQPVGRLGVEPRCMASVFAVLLEGGRRGWDAAHVSYPGDTIGVARGALATTAIEQGRDLLFWDADVECPAAPIVAMVERADVEFIGAAYRQHCESHALGERGRWAAPIDFQQEPVTGAIPAPMGLTLGLTVIRHAALVRMAEAHKDLEFVVRGRRIVGLFREDMHPETKWWRAEDIAFFCRAVAIGIKPWMVLDVPTVHHGPVALAGNLAHDFAAVHVGQHASPRPEAA